MLNLEVNNDLEGFNPLNQSTPILPNEQGLMVWYALRLNFPWLFHLSRQNSSRVILSLVEYSRFCKQHDTPTTRFLWSPTSAQQKFLAVSCNLLHHELPAFRQIQSTRMGRTNVARQEGYDQISCHHCARSLRTTIILYMISIHNLPNLSLTMIDKGTLANNFNEITY